MREIFEAISALLQTDIEPIYKPDLPGEAQVTLADITAAKNLGWQPKVSLKEGLQQSVSYIKDHVLAELQFKK